MLGGKVLMTSEGFVDVDEAARFLCVKKSTVYAWNHKAKKLGFPVRRHGRKTVYLKSELLKWSDEQNDR